MSRYKVALQWAGIILSFCISAYYLNWIAYVPAANSDGSLGAVLRLGFTKWYGVPAAIIVQLAIWWAMPALFRLTPSVWIAALLWPLISAICKVVIVGSIKQPTRWDYVAIVGMAVPLAVAWVKTARGG